MVIVRPTADLAKRMGAQLTETEDRSSTRLGDWYATDVVIERRQFVLAISEVSRLAVVLPAAPYASFPHRLPAALAELLAAIGARPGSVSAEVGEMQEVRLAKTASRSLLGSLNEAKFQLGAWISYSGGAPDPLPMSLYLSQVISLILPEGYPRNAALKALG